MINSKFNYSRYNPKIAIVITGRSPNEESLLRKSIQSIINIQNSFDDVTVFWSYTLPENNELLLSKSIKSLILMPGVDSNSVIDSNNNNGFKQLSQLDRAYYSIIKENFDIIIRTRLDVIWDLKSLRNSVYNFSNSTYPLWTTGGAIQAPNHLFDHTFMINAAVLNRYFRFNLELIEGSISELNKLNLNLAIGSHGWQFNWLIINKEFAASLLLNELLIILYKRGLKPSKEFQKIYLPFWIDLCSQYYLRDISMISDAEKHLFYPSLLNRRISIANDLNDRGFDYTSNKISPYTFQFYRSVYEINKLKIFFGKFDNKYYKDGLINFTQSKIHIDNTNVKIYDLFEQILSMLKFSGTNK